MQALLIEVEINLVVAMVEALLEGVRDLRVANLGIGVKPLLAKLREQQPELDAGCKEVREALLALKAESEAKAAVALLPTANEGVPPAADDGGAALSLACVGCARLSLPPTDVAVGVCALSDDALGVIFEGLRNVLDPGVAVDFGSVSKGLWSSTQAVRQELRTNHEAALVLCHKLGMRSCKERRASRPGQG